MNNPNLAVGGNGIGGTDNGQKKSLLDKLTNLGGAKQPEEPIDYSKLDNAKTKSMVESKRAAAAEELQRLLETHLSAGKSRDSKSPEPMGTEIIGMGDD